MIATKVFTSCRKIWRPYKLEGHSNSNGSTKKNSRISDDTRGKFIMKYNTRKKFLVVHEDKLKREYTILLETGDISLRLGNISSLQTHGPYTYKKIIDHPH